MNAGTITTSGVKKEGGHYVLLSPTCSSFAERPRADRKNASLEGLVVGLLDINKVNKDVTRKSKRGEKQKNENEGARGKQEERVIGYYHLETPFFFSRNILSVKTQKKGWRKGRA